jgi:hypothetical protein
MLFSFVIRAEAGHLDLLMISFGRVRFYLRAGLIHKK